MTPTERDSCGGSSLAGRFPRNDGVGLASIWLHSTLWIDLALLPSLISIQVTVSVALIEIVVDAGAGNLNGLQIIEWANFLAGFGAILLTFPAGAEIEPRIVWKQFWSSASIGIVGFMAPYLGVLLMRTSFLSGHGRKAQIGGISLSTTSVAAVYAVMIETGFNRTEIGKIILATCFIKAASADPGGRRRNELGWLIYRPVAPAVPAIGLGGPRCGLRPEPTRGRLIDDASARRHAPARLHKRAQQDPRPPPSLRGDRIQGS